MGCLVSKLGSLAGKVRKSGQIFLVLAVSYSSVACFNFFENWRLNRDKVLIVYRLERTIAAYAKILSSAISTPSCHLGMG